MFLTLIKLIIDVKIRDHICCALSVFSRHVVGRTVMSLIQAGNQPNQAYIPNYRDISLPAYVKFLTIIVTNTPL